MQGDPNGPAYATALSALYPLAYAVKLAEKARGMANFVWGCGCVPYDTPVEHVRRFKQMCLTAGERI